MEAILNTWIRAIGWSIFHSLWQGGLIYGLLFILLMAFPKLKARTKHNLAFASIGILFFAFCITVMSSLRFPVSNVQAAGESAINEMAGPGLPCLARSFYDRTEQLFPYLVGLYGLGILVQVFLIASGYYKLLQLKRSPGIAVPESWSLLFESIICQLKISKKVSFYLSESVNVPLVIGYFKPIVLFPIALATQLDTEQVQAILIHELSHIRRNDYLLNLIKSAIETILFFNPFVWLCSRFIQIEREHACDDLVIQHTRTPLTYAHALLKLELLKVKDTPVLSLAASGKGQHLYQRIKRITDMKTNYMNPKQQIFAITLTVATVISLAWINPKENEPATNPVALTLRNAASAKIAQPMISVPASAVAPLQLPIDTPRKKKKTKIVTVDANGKKTEYSSVSELPDSLKTDFGHDFFIAEIPSINMDTTALLALRKNAEALAMKFNSPEEKAKWKKLGEEMQKQGEALGKKFNSPEEKAKWKKLGLDMQKQAIIINKNMNSSENLARMKNLNEALTLKSTELQKTMLSPEIQKQLKDMRLNNLHVFQSDENRKLQNSEEYQQLKKEFESKVEALKKKQQLDSSK